MKFSPRWRMLRMMLAASLVLWWNWRTNCRVLRSRTDNSLLSNPKLAQRSGMGKPISSRRRFVGAITFTLNLIHFDILAIIYTPSRLTVPIILISDWLSAMALPNPLHTKLPLQANSTLHMGEGCQLRLEEGWVGLVLAAARPI